MAKRSSTRKTPAAAVPAEHDAVIEHATGTREPALQQRLIKQVADTLWLPDGLRDDERVTLVRSAISMLQGIQPTDETEGMLATQMVATHNAAMECLRRAMLPAQSAQGRDHNLRHAGKLLSLYARQIEVLDKHRGKGQQKVTVEYVNIESGGQAVVGHIETGNPARKRNRDAGSDGGVILDEPDGASETSAGAGRRQSRAKA